MIHGGFTEDFDGLWETFSHLRKYVSGYPSLEFKMNLDRITSRSREGVPLNCRVGAKGISLNNPFGMTVSKVRYIGSKSSQTAFILSKISNVKGSCDHIIGDLFSGTGAVSAQLKKNGFRVHANDYLRQCEMRAKAILLLSEAPPFEGLGGLEAPTRGQTTVTESNYLRVLSHLNHLKAEEGFFYREYSPEGSKRQGQWERKYFTADNARKIDAVRRKILNWRLDGRIEDIEHSLLLVSLIEAVNMVANISGTYGCFLKKFENSALRPFRLAPFDFVPGSTDHTVTPHDVYRAAQMTQSEIVYLDPPFTKRQYAAYYHIPETIAMEDNPRIKGKTGIREWKDKASDFYYKRKAPKALERLIETLLPRKILMSYSSDGHVPRAELIEMLSSFGRVRIYENQQKRFKSSRKIGNQTDLKEYLFYLEGNH